MSSVDLAPLRRLRGVASHLSDVRHPPPRCVAAASSAPSATKQPNLLYIISDQHNPFITGCYGDKVVSTPRLDNVLRPAAPRI